MAYYRVRWNLGEGPGVLDSHSDLEAEECFNRQKAAIEANPGKGHWVSLGVPPIVLRVYPGFKKLSALNTTGTEHHGN